MSTQAIQNPAIAPIVSVQPVKSAETSAPEASFSNVLSREMSNRAENRNNNDSAPKEMSNSSSPTNAPAPTKSAEKSSGKDSNKESTDSTESSETDDKETAINATTPAEMLSLVANIGQLNMTRIEPPSDADAVALQPDRAIAAASALIDVAASSAVTSSLADTKLEEAISASTIDSLAQATSEQLASAKDTSNQATKITDEEQSSLLKSQFAQALQKQKPKQLATPPTNTTQTGENQVNLESTLKSATLTTEKNATTGNAVAQTKENASISDASKMNLTNQFEHKDLSAEAKADAANVKDASPEIKTDAKFVLATKELGDTKPTLEQIPNGAIPAAKYDNPKLASLDAIPVNTNEVQVTSTTATPPLQQVVLNNAQIIQENGTDKLTPRVGTPAWDQALGQKVVWMIGGAQQSASLTLNPPDLGPLQIVLNVSNSQATAAFTASQPEVRQALEAAIPKLREILNDAGIQLGQASVSTGTPNQHNNPGERAPKAATPFAQLNEVTDVTAAVSRTRPRTDGKGMIDTFA